MYGNYSYPINGNVQQNLAQQRMNNLQNQYNQMFSQQEMMQQQVPQQMQMIKGRPVSSLEEARASMIDLDGSMYVFTDVANKRIYTKQILLDGTAELKTYVLEEQKQAQAQTNTNSSYVLQQDFEEAINILTEQINKLKGVREDEQF